MTSGSDDVRGGPGVPFLSRADPAAPTPDDEERMRTATTSTTRTAAMTSRVRVS